MLLWLFGIGAGVANGCLAAGGAAPCEGHRQAAGQDQGSPSEHSDGVDHPNAPAKTNCQDFCDKSSMSIPPLKAALDHAEGPALAPREIAMACAYMASTCDRSWEPRRDGARAPPITIAFLRLAL